MQHTFRLHAAGIAIFLIFLMLFSVGCAGSHEFSLSETSEQTSASIPDDTPSPAPSQSPSPTPALTMEQKASMVWKGDDFQTCYPMDVFVFSGIVEGKSRLIWTCLEDKQSNRTFSFYDKFSATELSAYDLFNREYLFKLAFPQNSLQTEACDFYKYVTELSPKLSNATLMSSDSLLNLEVQYQYAVEGMDASFAQNAGAQINSYIFNGNAIGSWNKSKAIEAYCTVTPDNFILPYWEYVPDTNIPVNFYSADAAVSPPIEAVVYSKEQKDLLLGSKPNRNLLSIGSIDIFLVKVNGKKRIIWTTNKYNSHESNDGFQVDDYISVLNNEYLFSLSFPIEELSNGIVTSKVWKYFLKSSTQLEGMKLLGSNSILDLSKAYSQWEIRYTGNELIDSLKASLDNGDFSCFDTPISHDELLQLYLDTVPDEYLMPFWEYVPNAVTPDGFFTPTPEIAPTPVP